MTVDVGFIRAAFDMASNDNERVAALDLAAKDYRGSMDNSVMSFLAETVLDTSYSKEVRLVAYLVLYEVSSRDLRALPNVDRFKMPESLDLAFLNDCIAKA